MFAAFRPTCAGVLLCVFLAGCAATPAERRRDALRETPPLLRLFVIYPAGYKAADGYPHRVDLLYDGEYRATVTLDHPGGAPAATLRVELSQSVPETLERTPAAQVVLRLTTAYCALENTDLCFVAETEEIVVLDFTRATQDVTFSVEHAER